MQSEFYHAELVLKDNSEERIENLTLDDFLLKIINPYKKGTEIFINGKGINPYKITRVHLRKTNKHTDIITKRLEKEEEIRIKNSGIVSIGGPYAYELAMYEGEDIIDEFITGSPGYESKKRNEKESRDINDVLESIEKKKIEWIEKISIAETEDVITDMRNFTLKTGNDDLIEEIVNQSQRWHRLQKKIRNNVLDSDKENIESNKINKALIQIINTLKKRIIN